MNRHELQKELERRGEHIIKSKDKLICYPYSLKWKGKTYSVTKDKKVLFSCKDEVEACDKFLSYLCMN